MRTFFNESSLATFDQTWRKERFEIHAPIFSSIARQLRIHNNMYTTRDGAINNGCNWNELYNNSQFWSGTQTAFMYINACFSEGEKKALLQHFLKITVCIRKTSYCMEGRCFLFKCKNVVFMGSNRNKYCPLKRFFVPKLVCLLFQFCCSFICSRLFENKMFFYFFSS